MIAAGSTSASIKIQLHNCNPSVAPDCSLYPVARASAAKYDAVWPLRWCCSEHRPSCLGAQWICCPPF